MMSVILHLLLLLHQRCVDLWKKHRCFKIHSLTQVLYALVQFGFALLRGELRKLNLRSAINLFTLLETLLYLARVLNFLQFLTVYSQFISLHV